MYTKDSYWFEFKGCVIKLDDSFVLSNAMSGHVYIAKPHYSDFFKVGYSTKIRDRVKNLRTCYGPCDVFIVFSEYPRKDEQEILDELKEHRRRLDSGRLSETLHSGEQNEIYERALKMARDIEYLDVAKMRDARVSPRLEFLVQWAEPYASPKYDSWEPYEQVKDLEALDSFFTTRRGTLFAKKHDVSSLLASPCLLR